MRQENKALSIFRILVLFSVLLLSSNLKAQTYCTPSWWSCCGGSGLGAMDNFSLTGYSGSSISDATPYTSTYYYDKTATVTVCNLQQGGSYPCTISYDLSVDHVSNQIWIDFNDDGIFDTTTENVTPVFPTTASATAASASSASDNVTIPITATPGMHRMRVRNEWYLCCTYPALPTTAMDPCNSSDATGDQYFSGITIDYEVNIVALASCSGKPIAGHLTGPTFICTNRKFTMVDTALLKYGGMTMQWQESVPGSGVWTDISGATQQSYTTSITSSTDFRMWAQCNACGTGSACTDTSYVLSVVADSFYHCYCALSTTLSPLGGGTPPTIDSVSIERTTLKNPTHYSLSAPDYYIRFNDTLNTTATIRQGGHYKLFESYKGGLSYGMAWIDFDRDGIFEPSEFVNVNSILSNSGEASFDVPANAELGKTGMRVRNSVIYSPYDGDACTEYTGGTGAGETQDYVINIAPAFNHDLGVTDITAPVNNTSLCANAIDSVYVNVHNFGANSESNFYVYATYTDLLGVSNTIYTKYIGSLDPASSLSVFVGVINPPDAGKYFLKSYTVISGDTVTVNDTSFSSMTLKPSPDLPITTSDTVCAGASSATVTVDKVPNVQNLWYASASDDIPFSTDSAVTMPSPSDTILFVTAKGANGCETSKVPAYIHIGNRPVVDLGPDITMCESPTFVLDAGVRDASYLWSNGDTTKTIHVTTSGTYSVNVFKYCSASDTINVTINPLPSGTGIDYTRAGTSYLFNVAGAKNINSYMWFFGDGDTSSLAAPLHTYKTGDIRTVEVVLYNNCGTDTITWTIPTGIGSLSQQDNTIKIYPNPANNSISISTGNAAIELKDILILNSIGAEIFKEGRVGNTASINVSQFPAGHYILRANTTKGYINRIFEVVH